MALIVPGRASRTGGVQRIAGLLLLIAAVMLLTRGIIYLTMSLPALPFPHQLDYGEDIVWQQMNAIVGGHGYAPIEGFPAIVFHYPPFYHLVTALVAAATGADPLFAGRLVSFVSTLACAVLLGRILTAIAPFELRPAAARWARLLAALVLFAMQPVQLWSTLMRVDLLCIALSLGGFCAGLRAIEQPRAVYLAALLFVAAIYTKQTAIAAPAAVFLTLLFLRPRTALAGIACTLMLGLAALAAMTVWTEGGFLRHIILYNINRFDWRLLSVISASITQHFALVACALIGVLREARLLRRAASDVSGLSLRDRLLAKPRDARMVMAMAYATTATPMLALLMKSGATDNYLIEFDCIVVLFASLTLVGLARAVIEPATELRADPLTVLLPAALICQFAVFPEFHGWGAKDLVRIEAGAAPLVSAIRSAPQPVISDDMVAVLRSGHPVLWEPAIFAELAPTGVWDETPLVRLIRAQQFAFVASVGDHFSPRIMDAIKVAYPQVVQVSQYRLRFPAGPLPAYALAATREPRTSSKAVPAKR